jgi:DNA-binding NarL/FixJ family response regulator
MTPLRILVVDDHSLFRRGIIHLLEEMPDTVVVGEAGNGQEALDAVERYSPDLILIDVNMPVMNGVEAVARLRGAKFSGSILMLTISQNDRDLFGAIEAGANGYLLKNLEPEDLRKAIDQVRQGMGALSPEVTMQVFRSLQNSTIDSSRHPLSPRELEVLQQIAGGATTAMTACELNISEATVKTHVKNILKKLDASNRVEAIHKANRLGLLRQG